MIADAKLFDVQRQKREDLAHRQPGEETPEPDRDQIDFPRFHRLIVPR